MDPAWHAAQHTAAAAQADLDAGYDRLEVLIRSGTTINGAVVALCPDGDGNVIADVCIDGPPVP